MGNPLIKRSAPWSLLTFLLPSPPSPLSPTEPRHGDTSLPPEILSLILEILHSRYASVEKPKPLYRTLLSVCRVCRSWLSVGSEFLYKHPILRDPSDIHAFIRTIKSSSDLPPLVRALTLVDSVDDPAADRPNWRLTKQDDPRAKEQRHVETMSFHITRILSHCKELRTLSITLRHTYVLDTKTPSPQSLYPIDNVRKLTVFGNTLEAMFLTSSFPSLEDLCIQNYCFTGKFELPTMPNVHTLRLHQPMGGWRHNSFTKETLHKIFPNLRSFEINKDSSFGSSVDNSLFTHIPNLEQLVFIEGSELRRFDWRDCPALYNVKRLVLGAIGYSEEGFPSWAIPPSVEDFTLFVAIEPRFIFEPSWRGVPVQHVLRWIAYNHENGWLQSGTLRRLEINICDCRDGGEVQPKILNEMQPMLDEIRKLCDPFNIQIVFNQNGSWWQAAKIHNITNKTALFSLVPVDIEQICR